MVTLMSVDPTERLSADDMATRREEEFRAAALMQARVGPAGTPGVCSNCDAPCLPLAVYCDQACRADHERRRAADRIAGRGG